MAHTDIRKNPTATRFDIHAAFDEWLEGLDTDRPALTGRCMETLAGAMGVDMAVRDAVILSIICSNDPEYDADKIRALAFGPGTGWTAAWCERMMYRSVGLDADGKDASRAARAIGMLSGIAEHVGAIDMGLPAQPFAVIGYVLWWMGDERAMTSAMRALAIDGECSLAAIVVNAIHADRWPGRD